MRSASAAAAAEPLPGSAASAARTAASASPAASYAAAASCSRPAPAEKLSHTCKKMLRDAACKGRAGASELPYVYMQPLSRSLSLSGICSKAMF